MRKRCAGRGGRACRECRMASGREPAPCLRRRWAPRRQTCFHIETGADDPDAIRPGLLVKRKERPSPQAQMVHADPGRLVVPLLQTHCDRPHAAATPGRSRRPKHLPRANERAATDSQPRCNNPPATPQPLGESKGQHVSSPLGEGELRLERRAANSPALFFLRGVKGTALRPQRQSRLRTRFGVGLK